MMAHKKVKCVNLFIIYLFIVIQMYVMRSLFKK
jgi:hypothetical protein